MFCKSPVPVFNTKNIEDLFSNPLPLSPYGSLLETEMIALEGTELANC